jgi:hypothetical protein
MSELLLAGVELIATDKRTNTSPVRDRWFSVMMSPPELTEDVVGASRYGGTFQAPGGVDKGV